MNKELVWIVRSLITKDLPVVDEIGMEPFEIQGTADLTIYAVVSQDN